MNEWNTAMLVKDQKLFLSAALAKVLDISSLMD